MRRRSFWALTLRVRLTMMYGATFLAAGALLVGVMYLLVRDRLGGPGQVRAVVQPLPGSERGAGLATEGGTPFEQPGQVDRATVQQLADEVQDYFDATLHSLLWRSVVVLSFATVLAIGLGWLMAGRALRPLAQVTETARRVSDRGLHERIALEGPHDEIKELADTFDAMLERLDRAFDGQRRFVANASHELRTPLATQRALLEVAASDPDADDEVRRMARPLLTTNARSERLIDGLLLLAQSEQELQTRQRVDLATVVEDVAAVVQAEAATRSIRISMRVDAAMVTGDPVLIEHLVMNLLQNAVRHNDERGTIHVACRRTDDDALLTVSNTGTELAGDVTTLFEPFRRGHERLNGGRGAGLGLSIVRAVTHAHRGQVEAHARPGGGMVVEVRLPAAS